MVGEIIATSFTVGSNLSCFYLECYRYKLLCISFMVTTKQKSLVNTQKINRNEYKHTIKEIQPQSKRAGEE